MVLSLLFLQRGEFESQHYKGQMIKRFRAHGGEGEVQGTMRLGTVRVLWVWSRVERS